METKKRRKKRLMPRLGPATNLRPGGAHVSQKLYDRKRAKAALREEALVAAPHSKGNSEINTEVD